MLHNAFKGRSPAKIGLLIVAMGCLGAGIGLTATVFTPKKYAAEAVILIGSNSDAGERPTEPAVLLLERLRSRSFLKSALKPKGLDHLVDALDSNIGGQLTAVAIRQAEAIKIQILNPSPEVAAAAVESLFEALRDDLDRPLIDLRAILEDQRKVVAQASSHGFELPWGSSRVEELNKVVRSIDIRMAVLRPTRLLSPVSVTSQPVFPKQSYFAAAGLVAGLLAGYMVASLL